MYIVALASKSQLLLLNNKEHKSTDTKQVVFNLIAGETLILRINHENVKRLPLCLLLYGNKIE